MTGRAVTAFGSLLFLGVLAIPGGVEAQQGDPPPVLPAICEPGSGASADMRAWCDRELEEGAVLPSQTTAPAAAPEEPMESGELPRGPEGPTLPDAGPDVPEPVLEEIPTLPRRSTDAGAAGRMEARMAAALRVPLERIQARVGTLEERRALLEARWQERTSLLTRSPDELLRQMTGERPPDLFDLLRHRRSRGPGR